MAGVGVGADQADAGAASADGGELEGLATADGAVDEAELGDQRDGEAAERVQAEQLGPPADRRGVEIGHAPDAAVDVLAAGDLDRCEEAGDRARRDDGVGDRRVGRSGRAEDDAAAAAAVDSDDPQAPVEAAAVALDRPGEVGKRPRAGGDQREQAGTDECARPPLEA
jgi:hypothetical protein